MQARSRFQSLSGGDHQRSMRKLEEHFAASDAARDATKPLPQHRFRTAAGKASCYGSSWLISTGAQTPESLAVALGTPLGDPDSNRKYLGTPTRRQVSPFTGELYDRMARARRSDLWAADCEHPEAIATRAQVP
jgi:hypothetical protein